MLLENSGLALICEGDQFTGALVVIPNRCVAVRNLLSRVRRLLSRWVGNPKNLHGDVIWPAPLLCRVDHRVTCFIELALRHSLF